MSGPPALPQRPATLANTALTAGATPYSTLNRPGYGGLGGYGSYGGVGTMGGMGAYSSPYSRFGGGFGGGMYSGGGFGMGAGMGGYGMGGMGDPNDPMSLSRNFENSTAATFQMIESIVGAFGGFAQMLESTYMATHSSFFGTHTHPIPAVFSFFSFWLRVTPEQGR